ncbi:MAG: hypothetical protein QOI05_4279, partial [Bradyrhizobium sp.]|nr:hypothetical protein [Bradyrhizobium sp.]
MVGTAQERLCPPYGRCASGCIAVKGRIVCRPERKNTGADEMLTKVLQAAALLLLLLPQPAAAQSPYPNRPVKILVGFTPGTAPDLAARILADRFSDVWGMPFVVEDIPGAGSNVATDR